MLKLEGCVPKAELCIRFVESRQRREGQRREGQSVGGDDADRFEESRSKKECSTELAWFFIIFVYFFYHL